MGLMTETNTAKENKMMQPVSCTVLMRPVLGSDAQGTCIKLDALK